MSTNFGFQQATARDRYSYGYPNRHIAGVRLLVRRQPIDTWIVFATVLASLAAAWVHSHNASIWYDEAITLLTASGHAKLNWALGMGQFQPSAHFRTILSELYQQDVHPPLYFWTLAVWRVVFGESLEVARGLSAVFTLGTLVTLYRVATRLQMKWPSVPVVIYAASAVGLRYAYNARPYAMASFLIVLTLLLALKGSRWTGVCAAACVATHYFAALCVVPILVFECAERWKSNRRWAVVTVASFAICCAPLLPLLRVHLFARPQQYPIFGAFPRELWALLKGSMEGAMPSTWLPHWGFALCVSACFVALGCWWCRKRGDFLLPFIYLAFLMGFFVLAILTNKSIAKMPTDYYLGLAVPMVALLIGFGVNTAPRASSLLAAVVVAGTVTSVSMTKSKDYRTMVQQIRSECPECPILVGVGYAGAIPACVLYEAKGANVFLLKPQDTVGEALERMGDPTDLVLVPANEPATGRLEREFIQDFPAVERKGYFEIDASRVERKSRNGLLAEREKVVRPLASGGTF